MHREVAAFDPVIETAVNRHVLAVFPQRLEQRGLLVRGARGFREEVLHLVAQQISDRDETPGSRARPLGCLNGGVAADGAGQE